MTKTVEDRHNEIAGIITEPIMCNNGCIMPQEGFLPGLRSLCDKYHIALIFDEVITGFRISLGGAQEYFGVVPDLSIFAKAFASRYVVTIVGIIKQNIRFVIRFVGFTMDFKYQYFTHRVRFSAAIVKGTADLLNLSVYRLTESTVMKYYQLVGTLKFEEGFEIQFLKSKTFNAVACRQHKGKSVADHQYREVAEFAYC